MTVQSMRPQLTETDIVRLMKGETSEERAGVAHRLCRRIAIDALSDDERKYAEEIIQILAQDAAELVRRTLSVTLRNSPKLPREVALKLAKDVESVALPVLENSPVFSDEDLREMVLSVTAAKQAAIAARPKVSSALSEMISEHAAEMAVEALAGNPGADMTEKAFDHQLSRFPKNAVLHEKLVLRDHVPVHIAEKMVSLVSGSVFDMLINRHELPAQMAIDLAAGSRERATIDLVEQAGPSVHVNDKRVHRGELLVGGVDDQIRSLGDNLELIVGDQCRDLHDDVRRVVETGHFEIHPDEHALIVLAQFAPVQ